MGVRCNLIKYFIPIKRIDYKDNKFYTFYKTRKCSFIGFATILTFLSEQHAFIDMRWRLTVVVCLTEITSFIPGIKNSVKDGGDLN